ncbi:MAG: Cof-type HAD-IIB family hydrolase [Parasporobacterium sp.]|nr:Cof-type HAD-IIB family hydrolase [Parasporobacterium sp.]
MRDRYNIRMIGLDLDGTVLNNKKNMTDKTAATIEAAAEKGILIVPVTGRPLAGIPGELLSLKGVRYAITSNGAVLTDVYTGEACETHFLQNKTAELLAEMVVRNGYAYSFFINGTGWAEKHIHDSIIQKYSRTHLNSYVRDSRRPVDDIMGFLKEKPYMHFRHPVTGSLNGDCVENIWIRGEDDREADKIAGLIREIDPGVNIIRMLSTDIEVVAADADKGDTFLNLAKAEAIDVSEIMAIGDSANDVGFMKKAGLSVAMGNASDDIKKLADHVTGDNEHDGAAEAILKFCM